MRHLSLLSEGAPKTRSDCLPGGSNSARPCPYSRCEYHLSLYRKKNAKVHSLASCVLDAADQDGLTLDEVGQLTGLVRERIRQIETTAVKKLADRFHLTTNELLERLRSMSRDRPKSRRKVKKVMLKIFLAGASAERKPIAEFAENLYQSGRYVITYPWWEDVERSESNGGHANKGVPVELAKTFAESNRNGIMTADIFWLLVPKSNSAGAFVELGQALEESDKNGKLRIVVSGDMDTSIYLSKASHRFDSHESAFQYLTRER